MPTAGGGAAGLRTEIGVILSATEARCERIRVSLLAHLDMELAAQFGRGAPHADARRAQREHERRRGFVGPPQPLPLDMQPTRIAELQAQLASLGGPAYLVMGIASSMRWLRSLCRDYARGRVMVWPFVKWEA